MKIFADRLKELRKERGLTLADVSVAIKVSINTVSRWERCERIPTFDCVLELAKFFKVSTDYLCGLED